MSFCTPWSKYFAPAASSSGIQEMSAPRMKGPVRWARAGSETIAIAAKRQATTKLLVRGRRRFRLIEFQPKVIIDDPVHRIARRNRQLQRVGSGMHERR